MKKGGYICIRCLNLDIIYLFIIFISDSGVLFFNLFFNNVVSLIFEFVFFFLRV